MAVNNYIKWPAERIRQDENNRLISDVQIKTWNGKADSDHNHDDKYIPLTGTVRTKDAYLQIIPENHGGMIGHYKHPFGTVCSNDIFVCDNSGADGATKIKLNGSMQLISWYKNSFSGDIGIFSNLTANRYWYLPDKSGTFALDTDIPTIPESLKNPNALSIQLNGGDANTYDGSAALNIDITPAAIGAVTSGDLAKYIPLTGTTSLSGDIVPNKSICLGTVNYPFSNINCRDLMCVDSNANIKVQIGGNGIVFKSADNSEKYGTINVGLLTNTFIAWTLPDKSGTFAMTTDIPKSLPASDVKDWAKADTKPTYTFAEITEKPEKFTPDTHTHTITEVTDLQTTLDGKAAKNHVHDSEKVTNWNNAIVSGAYYAAADAVNNPSADAAYSGNVVKGSTIVTQTVVKETINGDLYKYIRRGQLDTNRTTVTTWGQWQEIQYVVTE